MEQLKVIDKTYLELINRVSKEISTDGGSKLKTDESKKMPLKNWGIQHRKSSLYYPGSNRCTDFGVKSAKRIILNSRDSHGALDIV